MNLQQYRFNKTRIAPTPSGYLHVGNVLAFAITAALAEQTHAGILLRIDDMDRDRVQPEYVQDIFDTLHYLDLPWNEGPANPQQLTERFSQQHRLPLYNKTLLQLREAGLVYACDCSRTQIAASNTGSVCPGNCRDKGIHLDAPRVNWRLKTGNAAQLTVKTMNGPIVVALPAEIEDFVVRRKDGNPAYQLTSVVDDVYYGIDLVVRGEDLWNSTLAQLNLAAQLQLTAFADITFYHHPLLLDHTHKKLSKSAGATSVQYLRSQGLTAAAIYGVAGGLLQPEVKGGNWQSLAGGII